MKQLLADFEKQCSVATEIAVLGMSTVRYRL